MTDGPAVQVELLPLRELLVRAQSCAEQATRSACAEDTDPTAAGLARQATALAEASQAWSALAVARMRAGHKLDDEPKDPRAALRVRVGGTPL